MSTLVISVRCGGRETVYKRRFWEYRSPESMVFAEASACVEDLLEHCVEHVAAEVAAATTPAPPTPSQIQKPS